MVRPWNDPSSATIAGRPVASPRLRASLIAASFASAPELQKKTRASGTGIVAANRSASRACGSVAYRLLTMSSVSSCARTAATHAGWEWPIAVTPSAPAKSR